jgi:hypothetical protein
MQMFYGKLIFDMAAKMRKNHKSQISHSVTQ